MKKKHNKNNVKVAIEKWQLLFFYVMKSQKITNATTKNAENRQGYKIFLKNATFCIDKCDLLRYNIIRKSKKGRVKNGSIQNKSINKRTIY